MPMLILPMQRVAWLAGAGVLVGTTAVQGATEHLPALALRALVALTIVLVWPHAPVISRLRDLLAPCVALMAVLLGLLTTDDLGLALQALVSATLVVLLYLALLAHEPDVTPSLLRVTILVASVHALWALVERTVAPGERASAGFFNPNDLAALLAPLLVVTAPWNALADGLWGQWLPRRMARLVVWSLLAAALVATGSRSGLLAAAVGLSIGALPQWRRRWVAAPAAVLALMLAVFLTAPRWLGHGDRYAYSRLQIWQASAEVALANPLGVGLGGYADALRQHGVPLSGWVRYPKLATTAHSEPLGAWVEMGLLGLVGTLLPALMLLDALRRRRDATVASDAGVLAAFAIPALLSSSLHVPPVGFVAAIWAASAVRRDTRQGRTLTLTTSTRASVLAVITVVVFVATLGAVGSFAMQRAVTLREARDLERASHHAAWARELAPWSLGAAMLDESLRFLHGEPPLAVGERLIALAQQHPRSPEPVARAAWIIEQQATKAQASVELWLDVARLYAEAAERDPRNALRWCEVGRAFARGGDLDAAERAWTRALAEEPHCATALAELALLAAARGDLAQADALEARARTAHQHAQGSQGQTFRVLSLPPTLATQLAERKAATP